MTENPEERKDVVLPYKHMIYFEVNGDKYSNPISSDFQYSDLAMKNEAIKFVMHHIYDYFRVRGGITTKYPNCDRVFAHNVEVIDPKTSNTVFQVEGSLQLYPPLSYM